MWKKILIVVLVIAVLGGGYFWISNRNSSQKAMSGITRVKVTEAKPDSITTKVSADGNVMVEEEKEIKARLSGMVKTVWVENGDHLKEGDKIFTLDDESLNDQLETAELTLEEARVNYQSLQESYHNQEKLNKLRVEDARQNLEIAQVGLEKEKIALEEQRKQAENRVNETREALEDAREKLEESQYLYDNNAIPSNNLKQAEDAYKSAERTLEQARRDLEILENKTIPNSISLAQLRVDNAQNQLEYLKASIDKEKITKTDLDLAKIKVTKAEKQVKDLKRSLSRIVTASPISGTVINLQLKEGDKVMEGTTVGKVADLDNLIVEVMVDEIDINQVKEGQSAVITSDSFAGELSGNVNYIAPVGTKVGNINKYATRIAIEDNKGIIKPGMFVNAEIVTNSHDQVITIPAMALLGDKEKHVYVVENGKAEKRVVQEGLKTISKVEVQGVEAGEKIIIGPFSVLQNLKEGTPVEYND